MDVGPIYGFNTIYRLASMAVGEEGIQRHKECPGETNIGFNRAVYTSIAQWLVPL